MDIAGVAARRLSMDVATPGTPGPQPSQQRMAGSAGAGRVLASASRGSSGRQKSLSFWLLLVLYPFAQSLGTYPVEFAAGSVSAEFLFSLVCTLVVVAEISRGSLKIAPGNPYFLLGLALWLGANVASLLLHLELGTGDMVFRMLLKAMFGYMVFWVLQTNGGLSVLLKSLAAGCALSGLFTIVLCVETGSLELVRQASYAGLDPVALETDVFLGVARAGSGSLLAVWICCILYPSVASKWKRAVLLALAVCLLLASMLGLTRAMVVEVVVGMPVLWFAMPRRFRPMVAIGGLAFAGVIAGVIALSDRWQERVFGETRDQFEAGADPRTVLLLNTPAELMEQPLLGHGPGSYPLRMTKYFPVGTVFGMEAGMAAHNSFSRAAVEAGMIGLLGFTLMMAALGWRAVRRRSKLALSGISLRLAAIMIFLHVVSRLTFGDGITLNSTWFLIGVLLYLDRSLLREESRGIAPRL